MAGKWLLFAAYPSVSSRRCGLTGGGEAGVGGRERGGHSPICVTQHHGKPDLFEVVFLHQSVAQENILRLFYGCSYYRVHLSGDVTVGTVVLRDLDTKPRPFSVGFLYQVSNPSNGKNRGDLAENACMISCCPPSLRSPSPFRARSSLSSSCWSSHSGRIWPAHQSNNKEARKRWRSHDIHTVPGMRPGVNRCCWWAHMALE